MQGFLVIAETTFYMIPCGLFKTEDEAKTFASGIDSPHVDALLKSMYGCPIDCLQAVHIFYMDGTNAPFRLSGWAR